MERLNFDNAATTQMYPEVFEAMKPWMGEEWGNPSSIHVPGRRAKRAIMNARNQIADYLGAKDNEIIFTSGGTESDNLAIIGIAMANRERGKHIITSQIEHPAVLESCRWLESMGWEVTYLSVGRNGLINPQDVIDAIRGSTVLVSIMFANNEIGTVQPIKTIGRVVKLRSMDLDRKIYFHVDAVQAMGEYSIKPEEYNIDLMSMSAHKFHGPKGVGALYVKEGTDIQPIIHGGGQQWNMRSGTENVAGIVGMAKAMEITREQEIGESVEDLRYWRDYMWEQIKRCLTTEVHSNGSLTNRLANNLNITIDGVDAEVVLMRLDIMKICCSAGSACSSNGASLSHVLKAIGLSDEEARSTIRITLPIGVTADDIVRFISDLNEIVGDLREKSFTN